MPKRVRKADYSNRFKRPTRAHPRPSKDEIERRAAISRGMKRYRREHPAFRTETGQFERHLYFGVRDVREKATDDVDYEVPFVLGSDTEPEEPYEEVEDALDEANESYANFNVRIFADERPLILRIMERQGITKGEARDVLRQMKDEALDDGVSLVDPVPRERRSGTHKKARRRKA